MNFDYRIIGLFLISNAVVLGGALVSGLETNATFDANYHVTYGIDHILYFNQKTEAQLSMDEHSGAGFASNQIYGSGFFNMRMKLPSNDSSGVVTTFYLFSNNSWNHHDELDLEFLGNREGKLITLQTNVFVNGRGNREQKIHLWFDPSADFHTYKVLWNEYQIVVFIDETPIRVFKNNTNIGIGYPTQPMQVHASLWDGSDWATDGGKTKANYSYAPFVAQYEGFAIDGCVLDQANSSNQTCYSSSYWWNEQKYWKLDDVQQKAYEEVRINYTTYDYCTDKSRYPVPPPECEYNI